MQLLLKCGKRFGVMHLKDFRKGVQGDFTGLTPLTVRWALRIRQINIPAALRAAKKAGVERYYIAEEGNLKSVPVITEIK